MGRISLGNENHNETKRRDKKHGTYILPNLKILDNFNFNENSFVLNSSKDLKQPVEIW